MSIEAASEAASSAVDVKVLQRFADALREFKLGKAADPFDIVNIFRSICGSKALESFESSYEGSDEEIKDWELEAKLWYLVQLLVEFRNSEQLPNLKTFSFNSNIVYLENLYRSNNELREIWLIILWCQQNLEVPERPANLSNTKWLNTQLSNTFENLDIDAPLRLNKPIDDKDTEQDEAFYKYVYELILCGKFDEASNECERTNNWTMKMILSGLNEYYDPTIDKQMADNEAIGEETGGIKHKALWRRSVYLLSKEDKLTKYERLIYSFIAGDLTSLKETDTTWDSELLIYLNHVLVNELENKLIELKRINPNELLIEFPKTSIDLQTILNSISKDQREESEHPLRILIASVITNNISPIIHSSLSFIGNIMLGNKDSNEILNESYTLRVITHLAIFVSIINPASINTEDKSKLITTYILVLRFYEQFELIPLYISFLPELEAREAYSVFLIDLFDSTERKKQLELSRVYNLPLENILKRSVEKTFQLTEQNYDLKQSGFHIIEQVSEADDKLIRSVEWFIESNMYSDSIHAIISLMRRFLLTGRIKSAQKFVERNSISQLLKKADVETFGELVEKVVLPNEKEELLQYDMLIEGINDINSYYTNKDGNNQFANIEQVNAVRDKVISIVKSFFHNLVQQGDYEAEIIQDLRSFYIPYLIIELHLILVDASGLNKLYLTDALELTNLVASESYKFYLLFENCGRLKEYLNLVANCAAMAADEGL